MSETLFLSNTMALTQKQVIQIKKNIELSSLKYFFSQLKQVVCIPTGMESDQIYKTYFYYVKKLEKLIKRLEKNLDG